ncbi:MAG: hypothetical protein RIR39_2491 [Pseudomonadota bacterium]|jgi:hypothetical protein
MYGLVALTEEDKKEGRLVWISKLELVDQPKNLS